MTPRPPRNTTLPVNGVVGPTFHSAGPYTGRPCHVILLGAHNPARTWNRTRHVPDATTPWTRVEDITQRLTGAAPGSLVVLSGGEPLMHQRRPAFTRLLRALDHHRLHAHTNGTIPPTPTVQDHITHFTVSPELTGADPARRRLRPAALEEYARLAATGVAAFTFTASNPHDLDGVDALVDTHVIPPSAVWITPHAPACPGALAHHILQRGYNITGLPPA